MKNVVENIIANIIVVVLSAVVGFLLHYLGVSEPFTVYAALIALVLLFLASRTLYPLWKRLLALLRSRSIIEFLNQEACEANIRAAFLDARKIKILTTRGENYFLSKRSLFRGLISSKQRQGKSFSIEVLVLSPQSGHITEEQARKLDHDSAEHIKENMRIALENHKSLARLNKNFEVKCYDETPKFKILLFDDVMFVSSFADAPKNDRNSRMFQITREGNTLFIGFEKYFDDLWKHSYYPQ